MVATYNFPAHDTNSILSMGVELNHGVFDG